MKTKLKELDVDFIGGQGSLTKEELLSISKFIRANKEKHRLQTRKKKSSSDKRKQLA